MRKVDDGVGHGIGAAAVFVNARAGVERRRIHVGHTAVAALADDDIASRLRGASLDPVDVVAVEADLLEPDDAGDNDVAGERRFPGAIACDAADVGLLHGGAAFFESADLARARDDACFDAPDDFLRLAIVTPGMHREAEVHAGIL